MKTEDQKLETALTRWLAKLEGTPYAAVPRRALLELRLIRAEKVTKDARAEIAKLDGGWQG